MRKLVLAAAVLWPLQLSAQTDLNPPTHFGLAAGVAWVNSTEGLSTRVEYYPWGSAHAFSLRAEAGFRWTPTSRVSTTTLVFGASRFEGQQESTDVALGLTGLVTPWPRARVTPYLLGGGLAVQEWYRSMGEFLSSSGELVQSFPSNSSFSTRFALVGGLGLRASLFGHAFQLEGRHYRHATTVTLGAGLHF